MPVNTPHPDYSARVNLWKMIRDAIEGERVVKDAGPDYLPIPPGMPSTPNMLLDSGSKAVAIASDPYTFYLGFAEFPEIVEPALAGFQGVIHDRNATVKIPSPFDYLYETCCPDGTSLDSLWSLITSEVMTVGRIGLLIDVDESDQKLRIIGYSIENIINWREKSPRLGGGVEFLVLREPQQVISEKDEFTTVNVLRYRELRVNNGVYQSRLWEEKIGPKGERYFSVVPTIGSQGGSVEELSGWNTIIVNGRPLNFIPFVSINAMDPGMAYGPIPILPLVRRAYSIYRKTADYNRALYIKGDPQICIAGIDAAEAPRKVGGDGIWTFPNPDAKAWYLDIDGQGIPLMRQSIRDEYERFDMEGGKLLASDKTAPESGTALKQRQQAQQVNLKNVITNVGRTFEEILKQLVLLDGGNPEELMFMPDTDFAEPTMSAQELLTLTTAKNNGAPISYESMHELMRRGGMTEKDYEQEIKLLETDHELREELNGSPESPSVGNGTDASPGDPEDDEQEDGDGEEDNSVGDAEDDGN